MSVSVKYSEIIKQFNGEGDFADWIKKLELVAQLQKVKDLASFLPLFLAGGAFAVYDGLDDGTKADYAKLKQALREAFSVHPLLAYEQFVARRLLPGESVDVFLADLKRLGSLVDGSGLSEEWLKCALVHGLPDVARQQLKSSCSMERLTMSTLVERARVLLDSSRMEVGAASRMGAAQNYTRRETINKGGPRMCFVCNKEGHIARFCPDKVVTCYACQKQGHIAPFCPDKAKNL